MSEARLWHAVDEYFTGRLLGDDPDEALAAALRDSDAAGLPAIAVSPLQGKLLQLLAQLQGARTILEIGTLGGYSTIWLGRALPADGRLVSLEYDPGTQRWRSATSPAPVSASEPRCGWARRWSRCRSSRTSSRRRSTWCSSTPTRRTTRTTSSGRCG